MSPDEIICALRGISTATLHEVMDRRNTMWPTIRPLWRPLQVCGQAFTVQSKPADNLAAHWALSVAPPGSVLVISHNGDNSHAGWGDITSTAAVVRGLLGLVSDGAVRDSEGCRQLGFPIFCQGISLLGPDKNYPGALNVPITCGGTLVKPLDYIVADHDGVVVVPREEAEEVLRKARERDRKEEGAKQRLRNGEFSIDIMNLRKSLPSTD